nr:hypothetical protein Iba_chr07aCG9450 [Ipomoea batatas]
MTARGSLGKLGEAQSIDPSCPTGTSALPFLRVSLTSRGTGIEQLGASVIELTDSEVSPLGESRDILGKHAQRKTSLGSVAQSREAVAKGLTIHGTCTEAMKQDRGVNQRPNLQFLILDPRLDHVFRNWRGRLRWFLVLWYCMLIQSGEVESRGAGMRGGDSRDGGGGAAGSFRWSQALAFLQQLHAVIMAWMMTLRLLLDVEKQESFSPPMRSQHKSKRGNLPPRSQQLHLTMQSD